MNENYIIRIPAEELFQNLQVEVAAGTAYVNIPVSAQIARELSWKIDEDYLAEDAVQALITHAFDHEVELDASDILCWNGGSLEDFLETLSEDTRHDVTACIDKWAEKGVDLESLLFDAEKRKEMVVMFQNQQDQNVANNTTWGNIMDEFLESTLG